MTKIEKIHATAARYIKLGSKGAWEPICLKEGTLRLGYYEAPHEVALTGDKEAIRQVYLDPNKSGAATDHARQIMDFYDPNPNMLWITLSSGYLWWCLVEPEVMYLGSDPALHPHGSRLRRVKNKWSNCSVGGTPLRILELNGELTQVGGYRGTICDIKPKIFEYLLKKINDEQIQAVTDAQEAIADLRHAMGKLIDMLHWRDFELLVDLIFSYSGWQRISVVGDGLKTTDIELVLPSTGERAMVQVKSKTNQKQLDEYVTQFSRWEIDRLFYVYHTDESSFALETDHPRVTLIGPEHLTGMVMRAGLTDWLMKKAG